MMCAPTEAIRGVVKKAYRAVVIGGSSGAMKALFTILGCLPATYPLPFIVVSHLHKSDNGMFCEHLAASTVLPSVEAYDKTVMECGHIYTAPANYHLLVERDNTLALSVDPKVNWSRPSIDVLFESAARSLRGQLVGVILSGANDDGAQGMELIDRLGGLCIAQDPKTAESSVMPRAAIARARIDWILSPRDIGEMLLKIGRKNAATPNRMIGGTA
jgi:two-component system chemotaxis response regulator CheB